MAILSGMLLFSCAQPSTARPDDGDGGVPDPGDAGASADAGTCNAVWVADVAGAGASASVGDGGVLVLDVPATTDTLTPHAFVSRLQLEHASPIAVHFESFVHSGIDDPVFGVGLVCGSDTGRTLDAQIGEGRATVHATGATPQTVEGAPTSGTVEIELAGTTGTVSLTVDGQTVTASGEMGAEPCMLGLTLSGSRVGLDTSVRIPDVSLAGTDYTFGARLFACDNRVP